MSTANPSASPPRAGLRATAPGTVLADLLPGTLARDATLVVGAAALVGISAQVSVPLPFTPVPLTLQTLTVLLSSAALGWRRGTAAMALYVLAGLAGVPWFSGHDGGSAIVATARFGYLIGYVVTGAVVGALASRGGDRTPLRAAASMVVGTVAIYLFGVSWLMGVLDVGLAKGLSLGMTPFLVTDGIKLIIASALLPGAWRLASR